MLGRTTTKNQPLSARPMNPVKRADYCIPWQLAGIREQMPARLLRVTSEREDSCCDRADAQQDTEAESPEQEYRQRAEHLRPLTPACDALCFGGRRPLV